MKIKRFTFRSRRDFKAIYICEHCNHEIEDWGYDDDNFHRNVIPAKKCNECGKIAGDDHMPLATRYAAWEVI